MSTANSEPASGSTFDGMIVEIKATEGMDTAALIERYDRMIAHAVLVDGFTVARPQVTASRGLAYHPTPPVAISG